jgi:hypothetical protein
MAILLNPDLEQRIAAKVKRGENESPAALVQESLDCVPFCLFAHFAKRR